jgi:hypothetical protein
MTIESLRAGTVFFYPYLWRWQVDRGISFGKDRTCCLAFTAHSRSGTEVLIVVAISDQKSENCLEIPPRERVLGGLDQSRLAYLHLNEVNIDPSTGSFDRPPNPRILGRLSREFMNKVTQQLADNIKRGATTTTDRRK